MMPMLPPSHLESLAREHLGSHARLVRARHIEDPDAFRGDRSLSPGPVYTALRRLVTTGPIGAVRSRIERWFDTRTDRPHGARIEATPADDADRRIAA
jgi:hypothetical protein